MSWSAASMLILLIALIAGFAWWERSRPPSRLIALVATLAALAAIGRIAFAPIPNVKPTTDIVLFAGFALGAAPGFAVGATAALSSNFFFGQGPWTPWQMAAWGLVGVMGAGLGRVMPNPMRIPLALACAFAGLFYGELLDLYQWLFYSDQTLATWLATEGRSLTFNLAHIIGNVVFCLAFGPTFVIGLKRFRRRMSVRWVPLVAALLLLTMMAPLALANTTPTAYLLSAQNTDGGFGGAPGQASSSLYSGWAILGLEATGQNPQDVAEQTSALAYLENNTGDLSDIGSVERTIMILSAAGQDPRAFAGHDLVAELLAKQRHGAFAGRVNTTAFGILALEASDTHKGIRSATRWLTRQQNDDGGFNFSSKGGSSGIDDTSAPVQALVAAGGDRTAIKRAVRFIIKQQAPDGGFPLSPGGASNAQSTAWAVQALVAAGRNPNGVTTSRSPLGYLRSLTDDSGAVRYSRTSEQTPVWVTAQAVLALARKPFPLAAAPAPKPTATATSDPDRPVAPHPKPPKQKLPRTGDSVTPSGHAVGRFAREAGLFLGMILG
jgi:energy-coupling factor transport system substrate-specific component